MKPKPRVLQDLYSREDRNPFSRRSRRVNLRQAWDLRIPFFAISKALITFGALSYLVFGSALAPVSHNQLSLAAQDEEREVLERQLQELESKIEEYEQIIDGYRSQGQSMQNEINSLKAKINKINLQIKSINLSLKKLGQEIVVNKEKISDTEQKIEQNKKILERALQSIYVNENLTIMEILLRKPRLSDFFSEVSDLIDIQESMRAAFEGVILLREEFLDEKEALAIKKNDAEQLRAYQASQQSALQNTQNLKANILAITKGKEEEYGSLLKETQKTAAQIRSRIFQLLGGGELTFEKAYELAQFAERATGIRAALILAVLDRESALGQNVGKCNYETAMHPRRDIPVFLEIIEKLKENGMAPPEPIKVSCPNSDGVYGGAMGPAQFIPSTWAIYEDKIAEITGSNPPNPWSNVDAFVATALYLKDAYNSSACRNYASENSHISPEQKLRERCAAAKYYAGGRWYTYRWAYGEPVLERADRFQKDIDILNS